MLPRPLRKVILGLSLCQIMTLPSAHALEMIYSCNAPQDKVYAVARQVARDSPELHALTIIDGEHTIKAFVRNWRNFGVPVWILVQTDPERPTPDSSQLRLSWPQDMEPLNAPDLFPFMTAFENAGNTAGFHCASVGTGIGP